MEQYLPIATTLVVFVTGLAVTVRHFKIVRTVSYIERMNNPSMIPVRADVDTWLTSSDSNEERLRIVHSNKELNAKVLIIYNLLTELAIAHHSGILNKRLSYQIRFPLVVKYWYQLEFFIADARKRGRPLGFALEGFVKQVEKYQERRGFKLERLEEQNIRASTCVGTES